MSSPCLEQFWIRAPFICGLEPKISEHTGFFRRRNENLQSGGIADIWRVLVSALRREGRADSRIYRLRRKAPFWRGSRTRICRQVSWQNRIRDARCFDSSSANSSRAGTRAETKNVTESLKPFMRRFSSSMIAALFLIETAKSELEEAGLPQAEAVSKASDILAETTEKIAQVIGEADRNPE